MKGRRRKAYYSYIVYLVMSLQGHREKGRGGQVEEREKEKQRERKRERERERKKKSTLNYILVKSSSRGDGNYR